ncbi:Cryptochrome-1 [Frankliniella fusca]|uniref:Cryptochrome-1 n=1 Tax=Frankliniella fusca TaxID=407009 RepID=A0AAE1LM45_9NEOP|nr:Cryptochrome-1 [Frankliniella fusca]KAK3924485.1 Cryptochrome-1 [Frankliniella fusca]
MIRCPSLRSPIFICIVLFNDVNIQLKMLCKEKDCHPSLGDYCENICSQCKEITAGIDTKIIHVNMLYFQRNLNVL